MTDEDFDWNKVSPMAMWRDWVAKSEAQWSEAAANLLKDPKAGTVLTRQIEEARLAQRMFAEMAQASLAVVNLPSRSDVEGLDERMGRIEDGLAALGAELVRMREALVAGGVGAVAAASPPRSRRATAAAALVPKSAAAAAPPTKTAPAAPMPKAAAPAAPPPKPAAAAAKKR